MKTTNRLQRFSLGLAVPVAAAALFLSGCGMDTPSEVISPSATEEVSPSGDNETPQDDSSVSPTEVESPDQTDGDRARDDSSHEGDSDFSSASTLSVTPQEAGKMALDAHSGSRVIDIELDRSHGITVWEVKVVTQEAKFEVEINASTGEIVKDRRDGTDDLREYNSMLDTAKLSYADAIEAALAVHPGGTLVELELDRDNGTVKWEIEIYDADRVPYEMEIHAVSGKVLENDRDD